MRTEQILLDKYKEINYEIETLDLKFLGARYEDGGLTIGDSYASGWIDAKAKSVEIYLAAKLLSFSVTTAKNDGIINSTLPQTPTEDDCKLLLWLKIANTLAKLKARINDEYIGTDEEDYVFWVSSTFKPLVLLSTTTLGSDSAGQALKEGKIIEIGGIIIVECQWLGRNYPVGVIDKEEEFDFRDCDAVLVHKEALAFTFNRGQDNTFILQTNGNMKNLHKLKTSQGKALGPDLVKGFTLNKNVDISTAIEFTKLGKIDIARATTEVSVSPTFSCLLLIKLLDGNERATPRLTSPPQRFISTGSLFSWQLSSSFHWRINFPGR